jgi:hypothetical protein
MTVLGLDHDACVTALEQYLARIRELADAAAREQGSGGTGTADSMLDRLRFQLEVDAQSRASAPGRERMTPIEFDVFAPLMTELSRRLARVAQLQPPRAWVPALLACQATVTAVLDRIA